MIPAEGFEETGLLSDGRLFRVLRARRTRDGAEVALKFVAAPDPDGALEGQLRREFTLSASLDPDAVARALELLDTPSGAVLVREYRDARTLSSLVAEGPLAPALACALGIAICESLSTVHHPPSPKA